MSYKKPSDVNHNLLSSWRNNELEYQMKQAERQSRDSFIIGLIVGLLVGIAAVVVVGGVWV